MIFTSANVFRDEVFEKCCSALVFVCGSALPLFLELSDAFPWPLEPASTCVLEIHQMAVCPWSGPQLWFLLCLPPLSVPLSPWALAPVSSHFLSSKILICWVSLFPLSLSRLSQVRALWAPAPSEGVCVCEGHVESGCVVVTPYPSRSQAPDGKLPVFLVASFAPSVLQTGALLGFWDTSGQPVFSVLFCRSKP